MRIVKKTHTFRPFMRLSMLLAGAGLAAATWAAEPAPKDTTASNPLGGKAAPPAAAKSAIEFVVPEWWKAAEFDAVLHHGSAEERLEVLAHVAAREGPIANVHGFAPGEPPDALERLLVERVVSVNTAAAGGNATLMTVG